MQFIDAERTQRLLPFPALIDALRVMFISGCEVPLRHSHAIANSGGAPAGTMLLMPAWRAGRHLGIKTVAIFAGNAALGKPGLHSVYLLFDARTGEPLAQIDGDQITARRTAAASALAASLVISTPLLSSEPSMISASTRFLAQPSEMMPTRNGRC
jgi:ornithine cyclodeaminase/alanine dehydrogenase-like protein (mu-crystallin family)